MTPSGATVVTISLSLLLAYSKHNTRRIADVVLMIAKPAGGAAWSSAVEYFGVNVSCALAVAPNATNTVSMHVHVKSAFL